MHAQSPLSGIITAEINNICVIPKPTRLELRPASRKREDFQEWLKSLPDTWRVDKVSVSLVLKINCAKKNLKLT